MKVAFPVKDDNGLESLIDDHFGMAGHFLIVDTQTLSLTRQSNPKVEEGASSCKTSVLKESEELDAVVTKCMGDGTQRSMNSSNIKVFQAEKPTVKENLELLKNDGLKLFHIFDICHSKKNKKEGGCGHHH